jgi:hypothetical protein
MLVFESVSIFLDPYTFNQETNCIILNHQLIIKMKEMRINFFKFFELHFSF